ACDRFGHRRNAVENVRQGWSMLHDVLLGLPSHIQETSSRRLRCIPAKEQIAGSEGFEIGAKIAQAFPKRIEMGTPPLFSTIRPCLRQRPAETLSSLGCRLGAAGLQEHCKRA